jgi:hypothetical protein
MPVGGSADIQLEEVRTGVNRGLESRESIFHMRQVFAAMRDDSDLGGQQKQ